MVSSWDDLIYMQDMNPEACLEGNSTGKTLIDVRDGKSYTVAKLNDGKCWMTQNLSIVDKTIDSTNSDIETGEFTIPASNVSGFTSSDQYQSKAYYHASYGGYYNWYTATAGYGDSSVTTDGANVDHSICPKGWRLPTSGNNTTSDFYYLANGLTGSQIVAAPYNFVYGGLVSNSSLNTAGSYGYYWSSTANSASNAYYLRFSTSVDPSLNNARYLGFSVRCVAR